MTPKTGQKNDYVVKTPVSASDLNLRADLFDAQVFGALDGLGTGVIENEDGTSLLLSGSGTAFQVAAGAAVVLSSGEDGFTPHPVVGYLPADQSIAADADSPYIHAALVVAASAGAPDTQRGTSALDIIVSEDESVPGALLLGERLGDGTLVVRRTKIKADTALALIGRLDAILGYGDSELETRGSVSARLATLEGGGADGEPPSVISLLSQLKYNVEDPRNSIVVLDEKFAALRAELLAAIQVGGGELIPAPFDVLADNLACVAAATFELNPHGVERPEMAIIGLGYGHGQDNTPDFSPDTGDLRELTFDFPTGLFQPLVVSGDGSGSGSGSGTTSAATFGGQPTTFGGQNITFNSN